MKNLKYGIAIFTLLAIGTTAFAQEQTAKERLNPEQRAEKMVERMDKDLGLNDAQKKRLKELHMQQESMREEHRKTAIQQREKHRKSVDDVLTPEQRVKHKEMIEKHKQDGRKPRPVQKNHH